MVAEPAHGHRHRQCNQYRQQHRIAHLPRPGRANEQAVQQVTPHCNQRQHRQVGQIRIGRRPHTVDVGLQVDEQVPTQQEQAGKAQAGDQRPAAGHHQRAAQGVAITGANGMAAQCFHRVRQPVEGIGGQQQAVQQQGVGRHGGLTQARALHGNQQEHQLQRQATQEDVAVYRQQRAPGLPAFERRPRHLPRVGPQGRAGQGQAQQGCTPLGDHRCPRRTQYTPIQPQDEPQVQDDVQQVGGQQDGQRCPSVLGAQKPAHQRVAGQCCGQTQQAGVEEVFGGLLQGCAGLHGMKCKLAERQGQQADQHREGDRQQQPLHQHLAQRRAIATAGGLGGETGGAHAQEAHQADHEGEQRGAHGHGTQLMGVGEVADDRAVDQRHQRHGDVGQDHRRSQRPDLVVGRAVAPVGRELGHLHSIETWGRYVPPRGLARSHRKVLLLRTAPTCGSGQAREGAHSGPL